MGAVTALIYGDKDPSIAGLVLDSPFSSLKLLVEEIVKRQVKVADFVIDMAFGIVQDSVYERAKFKIKNIEPMFFAQKCFMPALFCVAKDDDFVLPHHAKRLYDIYPGDKSFLEIEGDHNSTRPKRMKDTATSFLYTCLRADRLQEISDSYMDNKKIISSVEVKMEELNVEQNIGNRMQQIRDKTNQTNLSYQINTIPTLTTNTSSNNQSIEYNNSNQYNNQNQYNNIDVSIYENNKNIISNIYGIQNETDEDEVLKKILEFSKLEADEEEKKRKRNENVQLI